VEAERRNRALAVDPGAWGDVHHVTVSSQGSELAYIRNHSEANAYTFAIGPERKTPVKLIASGEMDLDPDIHAGRLANCIFILPLGQSGNVGQPQRRFQPRSTHFLWQLALCWKPAVVARRLADRI
jgi:hypothetical protein